MFFIADLHTHSHYAGAASKFLCLETMYQWALIKGIDVVGTEEIPPSICPVCHKPLTVGVAHRVEQLANRDEQEAASQVQDFKYVLPLPEIFAEITGVGESSLEVSAMYAKAIAHFGTEFNILHQAPVEDIHRYHHKLSVAIDRLRQNKKHFTAGYDGAHGRVWFFDKAELNTKPEQMVLF